MRPRPAETLARAEAYLARHGVEDARSDAEALLAWVLGTDRARLFSRAEPLTASESRSFGRVLCRRCGGTPVQHLTGEQVFGRITLTVRPGVFVPRPETELLFEQVLVHIAGVPEPRVVDVGTGTGAIALAVKNERPDAQVWAVDRSDEAVSLARRNAASLGLDVEVLHGDLLEPLPAELRGRLDVMVSNPPYVTEAEYAQLPREVLADPRTALVGGTQVHQRLADAAPGWLKSGGWLVMEIGHLQGAEVAELLAAANMTDVEVLGDLAGLDRIIVGRNP